jgi:RNA polymerase sigma-70 factor (ECF subfamily)
MDSGQYLEFLRWARRHSRRAEEAEDLLQGCLLLALQEGRLDFASEENRRWFAGVLKNRAVMAARGAVRRRRREAKAAAPAPARAGARDGDAGVAALRQFPRTLRSVACLVVCGLNREEIAQALGISDAALRQRLSVARRTLARLDPSARQEMMALAYQRRREAGAGLDLGPMRRALLAWLQVDRGLGTHDPDGHLIVISPKSLTKRDPPATGR